MKIAFFFLIEMSDYNQNFKDFMPSVYGEKCLGLVMEFKFTKRDKFIWVT
jgi:hypothetical protein